MASALAQLGLVLSAQGRHEEAEATLTEALAVHEQVGGAEQDDTARVNLWIAETFTARQLPEAARQHLERAWSIAQTVDLPAAERAGVAYALARAMDRAGERSEARALGQRALEMLPKEESTEPLRGELEAWLTPPE